MNTAAQTPFAAPVVDELTVRVVVDSSYERFLPAVSHPMVKVQHMKKIPGRQMSTLAAEWGLSLHLESASNGAKSQYLLDFGYTLEILNRNFDLLGVDPRKINGLILSHGHRDHFGGLDGFVLQYRSHMRDDMSLYVGGEDVFREKWLQEKGQEPVSWGILDRKGLVAQHVSPVCCGVPHALDGCFTSGYIERNTFETVSGGTLIDEAEDHFTSDERSGRLVKDLHPEEHGTCYIIKGKGLVVISSCGHVGLINTIHTAMAVSNVDKVHAVIGGFHLGPAPLDYISHTVDELEALNPDVVVPMHCSGANFIDAMRRRMPDQLVTSNVGSSFTFGV